MSMDLFLWKAPVTDDTDDAAALLRRYFEDRDESVFTPSEDVTRVLAIIRENYPDDADAGAKELAPWASWPIPDSDRLIELNIRWGVETRLPADVVVLARKFELVLYDPQGPDLFLPTDPIEELVTIPRTTTWEWIKGFLMAGGLIALTYAAWLIPIGWIRWPAVVIAGFFAAAAVFVVGLLVASTLGFIDPNTRD
jgi:hypothetical protein